MGQHLSIKFEKPEKSFSGLYLQLHMARLGYLPRRTRAIGVNRKKYRQ